MAGAASEPLSERMIQGASRWLGVAAFAAALAATVIWLFG
jgi:hypothetical protein